MEVRESCGSDDDGAHFFDHVPHSIEQQGQAEQTRVVFQGCGTGGGGVFRHEMHPQPERGIAQDGEDEKDDVEVLE